MYITNLYQISQGINDDSNTFNILAIIWRKKVNVVNNQPWFLKYNDTLEQNIKLLFSYFLFGFEGRIWDLIVSVPDHCLSFYFSYLFTLRNIGDR